MSRTALLAALACLLLAGAAGWQGYRLGGAAELAKAAAALSKANAANAARQKEIFRSIDKVAQNVETERMETAGRLADAELANDELLRAIRLADAGSDTSGTSLSDAATARASLAECAARYTQMGRQHDELRAIVIGLQAYAREVSRN